MKVLVIGMDGQLGSELMNLFDDVVGTTRRNSSGIQLDIVNGTAVEDAILKNYPDVVINAAAFTNVDKGENDKENSYMVNAEAVRHIVRATSVIGAYLIHVSTDYVFDGTKGNYREDDIPNPINYYGLSKLMGDAYALSYDDTIVVRTSGVFGKKSNFPLFVAKTLMENKTVYAIDSYYSPISAKRLAISIKNIVSKRYYGILNIAGSRTSRYDLAQRIKELLDIRTGKIELVNTIPSFVAKRPYDSSLDLTKIKAMTSVDVEEIDKDILDMANQL
ncbi:SDR family oxidoreductase [Ferroplasma sp.]|uniref:SDR family oxidoreductase n=1 Tax=Ferroplasma sp. TaxID=2591003 RepID=UPI00260D86C3|nr:SDR family oxidoreductase [Ferroplasma sp.]